MRRPPIDNMTLNRWVHLGLVHPPLSGRWRDYSDAEVRAVLAIDSMRRLGPAGHELARTVAEAARSNPAGTEVDLPSPVPYVRLILVVPDA